MKTLEICLLVCVLSSHVAMAQTAATCISGAKTELGKVKGTKHTWNNQIGLSPGDAQINDWEQKLGDSSLKAADCDSISKAISDRLASLQKVVAVGKKYVCPQVSVTDGASVDPVADWTLSQVGSRRATTTVDPESYELALVGGVPTLQCVYQKRAVFMKRTLTDCPAALSNVKGGAHFRDIGVNTAYTTLPATLTCDATSADRKKMSENGCAVYCTKQTTE